MEYPSDMLTLWPIPACFERQQRYRGSRTKRPGLTALPMDSEALSEQVKGPRPCLPVWALAMQGLSSALNCFTDGQRITARLDLQVT